MVTTITRGQSLGPPPAFLPAATPARSSRRRCGQPWTSALDLDPALASALRHGIVADSGRFRINDRRHEPSRTAA